MTRRLDQLRQDWEERQQRFGATPRAVLFKRFPRWLNAWIHRQHLRFVLAQLPAEAGSLLDVGCGYGRISLGVKRRFPAMRFQGIDLCKGFAAAYESAVGPCFHGPIQDFEPASSYDAVLVITLLMYLKPAEQDPTLERLWRLLHPGGRMIVIEPAMEMLRLWRRLTGRRFAAPTGGTVHHFGRAELEAVLRRLPGAVITATASVPPAPLVPWPPLHHGIAVERNATKATTATGAGRPA